MNIKQLRLFSTIYETLSITTAAKRLNASQPAASKMLSALEEQVGYELFHRGSGRLQPTPEANLLIEEVRDVLHSIDQLSMTFQRAGKGAMGAVRLAATPAPSLGFLPRLVGEFQKRWSDTNFTMRIRNSIAIREMVATGQADIGIADRGMKSPRYTSTPVRMTCQCAVHRSNPAASLDVLTPPALASTKWITYGPEHGILHSLLAAYQQEEVQFQSTLTVDSTIQALLMIEMNAGAAIVDPLTIQALTRGDMLSIPNVVIKPFAPEIVEYFDVISVNSRPVSSAAKAFLSVLHEELKGFG